MDSMEQLSKKIEEQEAEIYQLHNIIQGLPAIVYWKDKDGKYLGLNNILASTLTKLGLPYLSPKEVIGKTDYDFLPKETANEYRANDVEVMATGNEIVKEEVAYTSDGNKVFQLSAKRPLRNKSGKITGTVGITVDITERREAEEALKKAKEQTEAANARIKAMAGSIAHELRTPLGAVSMNIGAVESALTDPTEENLSLARGTLETMRKEIESASTVINMLLMNIREDVNWQKEKMEPYSMNQCIEEALDRYPFLEEQKEKVTWKKSEDFTFKGNALFMQHVIFNLLKNALYQITNEGKGDIEIWTEQKGNEFELHFKDTAKGIPADILPHIFEKFFTNTKKGTGLGLAFCKMVIEAFGGTIVCNSEEGKYTEFVVRF